MTRNAHLWAFVCRLFADGGPMLLDALTGWESRFVETLHRLRAVKVLANSDTDALCPTCKRECGPLVRLDSSRRARYGCDCPSCGVEPIVADHQRLSVRLDPLWLARALCVACNVPEAVNELVADVWRLGRVEDALLLARTPGWMMSERDVLADLRRQTRRALRLIMPTPRQWTAPPALMGLDWIPLLPSFTITEGRVALIDPGRAVNGVEIGETVAPVPVLGPFSLDFRTVHLKDWQHGPIKLTEGQAAVFRALWEFKGEPRSADEVMRRAALESQKPADLFKFKAQHRGDPAYEGPAQAYKALVKTNRIAGTYAMPCAAAQ